MRLENLSPSMMLVTCDHTSKFFTIAKKSQKPWTLNRMIEKKLIVHSCVRSIKKKGWRKMRCIFSWMKYEFIKAKNTHGLIRWLMVTGNISFNLFLRKCKKMFRKTCRKTEKTSKKLWLNSKERHFVISSKNRSIQEKKTTV